jgi:hypothetical protein
LNPGQIYNDTIISTVKEKNKLVKYSSVFKIKNIGLILRENVVDSQELPKWIEEKSRIRDSIDLEDLKRIENIK